MAQKEELTEQVRLLKEELERHEVSRDLDQDRVVKVVVVQATPLRIQTRAPLQQSQIMIPPTKVMTTTPTKAVTAPPSEKMLAPQQLVMILLLVQEVLRAQ